jgi:hypothetical protein
LLALLFAVASTPPGAGLLPPALPQAGAGGAEQAGCGWDVFIETWTMGEGLNWDCNVCLCIAWRLIGKKMVY